MNYLKNRVSGYFSSSSQQTNNKTETKPSMQKAPSSQKFEIIVMEDEVLNSGNPNNMLQKSSYYILQNQFNNHIIVEKSQQERVLNEFQWATIINNKSFQGTCRRNLILSIFKGITPNIRTELWCILAGTNQMANHFDISYLPLLSQENQNITAIRKDVCRTPGCEKTRQMLENVLLAYTKFDPIGYTQGMNLIVASLLNLLVTSQQEQNSKIQQRAFWIFVGIMYGKNWRQYFSDLKKIQTLLFELRINLIKHVPEVLAHIETNDLDLNICFSQYYITLVLYNSPKELATIVLDLFLLEGCSIIHSFIVKIIKMQEDKILAIKQMGDLVQYFKIGILEDCNQCLLRQNQTAERLDHFSLNFFVLENQ